MIDHICSVMDIDSYISSVNDHVHEKPRKNHLALQRRIQDHGSNSPGPRRKDDPHPTGTSQLGHWYKDQHLHTSRLISNTTGYRQPPAGQPKQVSTTKEGYTMNCDLCSVPAGYEPDTTFSIVGDGWAICSVCYDAASEDQRRKWDNELAYEHAAVVLDQ